MYYRMLKKNCFIKNFNTSSSKRIYRNEWLQKLILFEFWMKQTVQYDAREWLFKFIIKYRNKKMLKKSETFLLSYFEKYKHFELFFDNVFITMKITNVIYKLWGTQAIEKVNEK